MKLSRWGIFLIDLGIVVFSLAVAHLLRFNFELEQIEYAFLPWGGVVLIGLRVLSFAVFRIYSGIIYYTGLEDAKRIFYALASGSLLMGLLFNPILYGITDQYLLPYSITIIEFSLSIFLMTAYRGLVKILYMELTNARKESKKVVIYGAGEGGVTVKQVLERDAGANYSVSAFIDDNEDLQKKRILGIEIFPGERLERLLLTTQPDILIFSTLDISAERRQEVIEQCLKNGVKVLNVPPVDKWINGELSFRQIRQIRIEDLLERDVIQLDKAGLEKQLTGKVILITGAAGSIGSELARQVIRFQPKQLVLLDQAETPLHELDLELRNQLRFGDFEVVLGDVRNAERMERVFSHFKPNLVYHAAAYKHVPMMEHNPSEAILANVQGTKVVADSALRHQVERFVLVSTDKAVNPTNVMGASKRMAEIYIQSLDRHLNGQKNRTRFITTRFGNVLGSNGSVIPLFKRQIAEGGPVTVTHPEMTRYFMTIPEACQLVMEAGAMGGGGEIFVFDMGQSIKILDLAKKMIQLSGLKLGSDIHIAFTGLRPGEKLYEELLNQAETTLPTHHPKILIARVREYSYEEVNDQVSQLIDLFATQKNDQIVARLKAFIPEYKSNNSVFEDLD